MQRQNLNPSHYKNIKKQFVENYASSGAVIIAPLSLSKGLLTANFNAGDLKFTGFFRILGLATLPVTIAITPITLTVGVVGAIANTAWGAYALPLAKIKDKNNISLSTEIKEVVRRGSLHEEKFRLAALDHKDSSVFVARSLDSRDRTPSRSLSELISPIGTSNESDTTTLISTPSDIKVSEHGSIKYNPHFKIYLQSLIGKVTLCERIASLDLSEKEEELFAEFKDSITDNYMNIPVQLYGKKYDLESVKKFNGKDPYTQLAFSLSDVQAQFDLLDKFEQIVKKLLEDRRQAIGPTTSLLPSRP